MAQFDNAGNLIGDGDAFAVPWPAAPSRIDVGPGSTNPGTASPGGPRSAPPIVSAPIPTAKAPSDSTKTFDAHHYAMLQEGNILVDNFVGIPFLLTPSTVRNFLGLRNASAAGGANIFIGFGAQASASSWLRLAPGDVMALDDVTPQNDLYCFGDAAGGILTYAVSNIPGSLTT